MKTNNRVSSHFLAPAPVARSNSLSQVDPLGIDPNSQGYSRLVMRLPKRLLGAAFVGLLATQSSASVITYAEYSHDTSTDIVVGGGLEWMQWDVTANQSIDSALGVYTGSGWRLASNTEMSSLINSFAFGGATFDADEDTSQTARFSFLDSSSENEITNIFISMFGDTHAASGAAPIGTIDNPWEVSGAYFGEDGDGDGLYNFASISDDYTVGTGFGAIENFAFATLSADFSNDAATYPDFGVALVRAVPSPGTLMLLALGLALACVTRRTQWARQRSHVVERKLDVLLHRQDARFDQR